jgi:hypothetical protein
MKIEVQDSVKHLLKRRSVTYILGRKGLVLKHARVPSFRLIIKDFLPDVPYATPFEAAFSIYKPDFHIGCCNAPTQTAQDLIFPRQRKGRNTALPHALGRPDGKRNVSGGSKTEARERDHKVPLSLPDQRIACVGWSD